MLYNPQLSTFITAVECGSFHKAATVMYISPSAVIKQINHLESDLGTILLRRTAQGVRLTENGRTVYEEGKKIIQQCSRLEKSLCEDHVLKTVIRVGNSFMAPCSLIFDLLQNVRKWDSTLEYKTVTFVNSQETVDKMQFDLWDSIDILPGYFDEEYCRAHNCRALEIDRVPLCCIMSAQNPLASCKCLPVRELGMHSVWSIKSGWSGVTDKLFKDVLCTFSTEHVKELNVFSLEAFDHISQSMDLMIAFRGMEMVHPGTVAVPVDWPYKISRGILYPRTVDARIQHFISLASRASGEKSMKVIA